MKTKEYDDDIAGVGRDWWSCLLLFYYEINHHCADGIETWKLKFSEKP